MAICALCREESKTLIQSHLMPKAVYRVIQQDGTPGKNQIWMDFATGTSYYSNRQIKRYLLCADCEDLFSKKGERVLGSLWATKAGFALRDKLLSSTPLDGTVYDPSVLANHEQEALLYFAISICWRANAWPEKTNYTGALGQKYDQNFREYLLGQSALNKVKLLIEVNRSKNPVTNFTFGLPWINKKHEFGKLHSFFALGIKFNLIVGQPSALIHDAFLYSESPVILFLTDIENQPRFSQFANRVKSLSKLGKLRADYY